MRSQSNPSSAVSAIERRNLAAARTKDLDASLISLRGGLDYSSRGSRPGSYGAGAEREQLDERPYAFLLSLARHRVARRHCHLVWRSSDARRTAVLANALD
jgi:hypothetical protein